MNKKLKNPRSQTMDKMSEEAKKLLNKFREHFKTELTKNPELNTTWTLLRFLRARNFDLKKAIKMFKDYIDYRNHKNYERIKTIGKEEYEYLLKEKYSRGTYNTDKMGRPIIIERIGFSKVNELLELKTKEEIEDYFIQLYERLLFIQFPICSKVKGKRIDKFFGIMDLKKVHLVKILNKKFRLFLKNVTHISQNYYPEILGKLFIINAGYFFRGVWGAVSVMLDDYTKNKIVICSGSGKKEIAKFVEKNNLPTFFNGSCEIPLYMEPGPWKDYVEESFKKKTFFLEDRTPEYQYFYTDEEKINLKKNKINTKNEKKQKGKDFYLSKLNKNTSINRSIKNIKNYIPPRIYFFN